MPTPSTRTTSQLLDEALQLAQQLGYQLRHDYLGGAGSGYYTLGEQRWIVLDVAQPTEEQLEQVAAAIRELPGARRQSLSKQLQAYLQQRQA